MKIDFQVIPHHEQRYETVGDYFLEPGEPGPGDTWVFRVSRMSDYRYHWLVFLHEFIEATLLYLAGIEWTAVDEWDKAYEAARAELLEKTGDPTCRRTWTRCDCAITGTSEPGDDRHAPYRKAHLIATMAEKAAARLIGVKWRDYNREVESL